MPVFSFLPTFFPRLTDKELPAGFSNICMLLLALPDCNCYPFIKFALDVFNDPLAPVFVFEGPGVTEKCNYSAIP